jgi:hypothetical protein
MVQWHLGGRSVRGRQAPLHSGLPADRHVRQYAWAPVRAVEQGLRALAQSSRTDPAALDTVVVSLMSLDSSTRQLVPLLRVARPSLSSSACLRHHGARRGAEAARTLHFSGGHRGVERGAAARLEAARVYDDRRYADGLVAGCSGSVAAPVPRVVVGCALSDAADVVLLRRMTRAVASLSGTEDRSIAATFEWVAARARVFGASIEAGQADGIKLPPLPPNP